MCFLTQRSAEDSAEGLRVFGDVISVNTDATGNDRGDSLIAMLNDS
jgi:hypothetical protein